MIKTAIQLKAKIRNVSGSDSKVAMTMIRVFFMERFLERVSISAYKNHFVLKGGMLVSSLIGLNSRATMDIDASVQALPLTQDEIEKIVNEIGGITLEDNVSFEIISIETIMDEFDYPGVRVHMEGKLDNLKQHPDTLWCYGNHDLSYVWGYLETGYSVYAENTVVSKLRELENSLNDPSQIAIIQRVDKVLFAHGGLSAEFVRRLDESLVDADIDEVLHIINNSSMEILWKDDSPLWLRPQYHLVDAFRKDEYTQVVGHTPVEKIFEESGFISVDVFSTYRDKTQIGESAFLVIETETGEYEVKQI